MEGHNPTLALDEKRAYLYVFLCGTIMSRLVVKNVVNMHFQGNMPAYYNITLGEGSLGAPSLHCPLLYFSTMEIIVE